MDVDRPQPASFVPRARSVRRSPQQSVGGSGERGRCAPVAASPRPPPFLTTSRVPNPKLAR
eukprot:500386-Pleurochrysis_carterae.AAC.4